MKIINSNTIHKKTIHSDICIIGAGPAGVVLASKLADLNRNIILVESGGKTYDLNANDLNKLQIESNFNYRNRESRRNRQIGGTANLWVGRVVPFSFDPVLDAEWGDLKKAVLPFYDDAFRLFGIAPEFPKEKTGLEGELVAYWAHKTERFNAESKIIYQNKNVKIYQYLTCTGAPGFSGSRLSTLAFVNQKKERTIIQSHCFVFAMGAIENSRILLAIRNQMEQNKTPSIKNAGKYVMDHPRIWHGSILNDSQSTAINNYQLNSSDQGICKKGIRNEPVCTRVYSNVMKSVNRAMVLLNKISILSYQVSSKRLILREKGVLRLLANELAGFPLVRQNTFLKHSLRGFFNYDSSSVYRVMTYCEQRPRLANKIILAKERDRNDLPVPVLKNNMHDNELNEVAAFFDSLKDKISGMGAAFEYNHEYLLDPANYTDASHIMGGTRYSNQKEKAVLNMDLSVIGIPNLHITGSSVFPTSSVENPTHLIVSLSCYLAEVLKRKFE